MSEVEDWFRVYSGTTVQAMLGSYRTKAGTPSAKPNQAVQ